MSSQPVLLADGLAAALRSRFNPGHLGKWEIVIDVDNFYLFSRDYPLKFYRPDKDIHRTICDPISQDLLPNIAVEHRLRTTAGELRVITAQLLNGLLDRNKFKLSLSPHDADLLASIKVEDIGTEEMLKNQVITLLVSFNFGRGEWKSTVDEMPLYLLYSAVDLKRIWAEAKNPSRINFTEFLGSSGAGS